ncbi:MAG: acyl-CoA desaturase [Archangiaceae bacterium]|nr:acyl-CoA desaturase [Archangiaceae bacterium]
MIPRAADEKVDGLKSLPFVVVHLAALVLPFVTGVRWQWVALALFTYGLRMFFVTAGYHRYFSHRAFKTSRAFQFVLAFMAETSAQKGVLWWGAHHRHHHRYSDQVEDLHSPALRGFWWSHLGWILCRKYERSRVEDIRDFARFPELRFLDRFYLLPPALAVGVLWLLGGLPWVVWGGLVSTVLLWHGTFFINSLSHVLGKRRYLTTDLSRNHWLLALIAMGEGWHNNHHYHQNTANQGWFWWEFDLSYYLLRALSVLGLVWDLRTPSDAVKLAYEKYTPAQRAQLERESRFGTEDRRAPPTPPLAMLPGAQQPS